MRLIDYYAIIVSKSKSDDENVSDLLPEFANEARKNARVLSDEELWKSLGQKAVLALSSLYPLLCFIRQHKDENDVVYISQKVTSTNNVYPNPKAYNKWIKRLLECECIYRLGIPAIWGERAYYYFVNQDNFDRVFRWALEQHSDTKPLPTESPIIPPKKEKGSNNVILNGLLPLEKAPHFYGTITNIPSEYTEEQIMSSLHDQYTLLLPYQLLVCKLNKQIEAEEEKIKFTPKIHFSKKGKTTKISIRATSSICSYTSIEKQKGKNPNFVPKKGGKYREPYLSKRLGPNYQEFDVKASVPRVAHAMHLYFKLFEPQREGLLVDIFKVGMGDLKEDIYKVLFEQFVGDVQEYIDETVTTWEEAREFFKGLFMKLYFGGSVSQIRESLINEEQKSIEKDKEERVVSMEEERAHSKFTILHREKKVLDGLIRRWKKPVDDYCGGRTHKNTEVFFHESCIYLEVRAILASRNIDVVQVYDGFYFADEVPADMEEIVQQAFRNYLDKPNIHASYYAYLESQKRKKSPLFSTN